MKYLWGILLPLLLLVSAGCQDEEFESPFFRVEVIGKGIDCGDTYLVRFQIKDEERINNYIENTNAYFPVFYAIGLVKEHKQEGLKLKIEVENINNCDLPLCTALGPGYGNVCIKTSEIY